ncbi:hypothetical protein WJX73_001223 [Symbiochloris irregularis]|uniref:Uncharacterized protein n=1 Tax=Symbiochloris irregularis TaxID=706552 RepID=A0AAW1NVR8_9CHLO
MVATLQQLFDALSRDEVLLTNALWALSALLSAPGSDIYPQDKHQELAPLKPQLDKLLKAESQHVRLAAAITLDLVARAAVVA